MHYIWIYIFLLLLSSITRLSLWYQQFLGTYELPQQEYFKAFLVGMSYDSLIAANLVLLLLFANWLLRYLPQRFQQISAVLTFLVISAYSLLVLIDLPFFLVTQARPSYWLLLQAFEQDWIPVLRTIWKLENIRFYLLVFCIGSGLLLGLLLFSPRVRALFSPKLPTKVWPIFGLIFVSGLYLPFPLWRSAWASALSEHATILSQNTLYNISVSYYVNKTRGSSHSYFDKQTLDREFRKLFVPSSELTERIVPKLKSQTQNPPHVVVILMEYMGAYWLDPWTPQGPKVAPFLSSLARESIVFDQIYAVGLRTQHGLVSTMSSFPSILGASSIRGNHARPIPTIASYLPDYRSFFVCSGDIHYDAMGLFAKRGGFQTLVDQEQFALQTKFFTKKLTWGYPDHEMFAFWNEQMKVETGRDKPVISFILTTSNHEPFDLPLNYSPAKTLENKEKIESGIRYADWALGEFFRLAKKEAYFQNTVFVLIADHSRAIEGEEQMIKRFHIPLLIYSPLLKDHAGVVHQVGSQTDVLPTVLGLLGHDLGKKPFFGRDLLQVSTKDEYAVSRDENLIFLHSSAYSLQWNILTDQSKLYEVDSQLRSREIELLTKAEEQVKNHLWHAARVYYQTTQQQFQMASFFQREP